MKLINSLMSIALVFGLLGCKPDKEPAVNEAPEIAEAHLEFRHSHDDFWDSADLYSKYYVALVDSHGQEDIVYLSVKDCDTCNELILKDITSTDSSEHIDHYDASLGYYTDNTFWYHSNNVNRRPTTMIITARDSLDQITEATYQAKRPDLTDISSEEFFYAPTYISEDSGDISAGAEVLAIPTASNASITLSTFSLTLNTQDANVDKVVIWLYNASDEVVGIDVLDSSLFQNDVDYDYSVSLVSDDIYIDEEHTISEINYVHVFTYSAPIDSPRFADQEPHHSISAKISVTQN